MDDTTSKIKKQDELRRKSLLVTLLLGGLFGTVSVTLMNLPVFIKSGEFLYLFFFAALGFATISYWRILRTEETESVYSELRVLMTVLLTVAGVILVSCLVRLFYHPDLSVYQDEIEKTMRNPYQCSLEPVEKMQYLLSLVLSPVIVLVSYWSTRFFVPSENVKKQGLIYLILSVLLFSSTLSCTPWVTIFALPSMISI